MPGRGDRHGRSISGRRGGPHKARYAPAWRRALSIRTAPGVGCCSSAPMPAVDRTELAHLRSLLLPLLLLLLPPSGRRRGRGRSSRIGPAAGIAGRGGSPPSTPHTSHAHAARGAPARTRSAGRRGSSKVARRARAGAPGRGHAWAFWHNPATGLRQTNPWACADPHAANPSPLPRRRWRGLGGQGGRGCGGECPRSARWRGRSERSARANQRCDRSGGGSVVGVRRSAKEAGTALQWWHRAGLGWGDGGGRRRQSISVRCGGWSRWT